VEGFADVVAKQCSFLLTSCVRVRTGRHQHRFCATILDIVRSLILVILSFGLKNTDIGLVARQHFAMLKSQVVSHLGQRKLGARWGQDEGVHFMESRLGNAEANIAFGEQRGEQSRFTILGIRR